MRRSRPVVTISTEWQPEYRTAQQGGGSHTTSPAAPAQPLASGPPSSPATPEVLHSAAGNARVGAGGETPQQSLLLDVVVPGASVSGNASIVASVENATSFSESSSWPRGGGGSGRVVSHNSGEQEASPARAAGTPGCGTSTSGTAARAGGVAEVPRMSGSLEDPSLPKWDLQQPSPSRAAAAAVAAAQAVVGPRLLATSISSNDSGAGDACAASASPPGQPFLSCAPPPGQGRWSVHSFGPGTATGSGIQPFVGAMPPAATEHAAWVPPSAPFSTAPPPVPSFFAFASRSPIHSTPPPPEGEAAGSPLLVGLPGSADLPSGFSVTSAWESLPSAALVRRLRLIRRDKEIKAIIATFPSQTNRRLLEYLAEDAEPGLLMRLCGEQRGIIVSDLFEVLGGAVCEPLFRALAANFEGLVVSQRGSVALVRVYEAASPDQRQQLAHALLARLVTLIFLRYANFVVRRVVEDPVFAPAVSALLLPLVSDAGALLHVALHPHASHVLEAFVGTAAAAAALHPLFMQLIAMPHAAHALVADRYGNYVLQSWLRHAPLDFDVRLRVFHQLKTVGEGEQSWNNICAALFAQPRQ